MRVNDRRAMMAKLLDELYARIDDAVAREIILKNWGEADGKHILTSKLAAVTNVGWRFKGTSVKNIDWLRYFSALTTASSIFQGCKSIEGSVNLRGCVSSAMTDLTNMFNGCNKITTMDCSNWDISNVTRLASTFMSCSNLQVLNVSGWNTSNVSTFENCFRYCGSLTEIDLTGWTISTDASTTYMFLNCSALKDIKGLGDTGLTSIGQGAFSGCGSLALTSLPSGLTSIGAKAFWNCGSLALTSLPEGLTEIENGVFMNIKNNWEHDALIHLKSIGDASAFQMNIFQDRWTTLGDGITYIGGSAFFWATLDRIKILATTPPQLKDAYTVGNNTFVNDNRQHIQVYVPDEALDAYKSADNWSGFAKNWNNIHPMSEWVD